MKITPYFTADKNGKSQKVFGFYPGEKNVMFGDEHFVRRSVGFTKKAEIEVPVFWSETACSILADKYIRKSGVPDKVVRKAKSKAKEFGPSVPAPDATFGGETTVLAVIHRLAGCWTYWGIELGYFDTHEDAQTYYNEMCYMLLTQRVAPNSPQWFNTGLNWAYGISGTPQGHWHGNVGPDRLATTDLVIPSKDAYSRPQPSACFIQSIDDDLVGDDGIMSLWKKESLLFKYGSGTGTNFSRIRGKGEKLSGGGTSSGLMSFLKIGDVAAGSIKSGGTCLTGKTPVYTDQGFIPVEKLVDKTFLVLSTDMRKKNGVLDTRIVPKKATAFYTGRKNCVRVTTDKGVFETSFDHPFLTKTGKYIQAGKLKEGMRLSQTTVTEGNGGYAMYKSKGWYNKGKRVPFHRAVAKQFIGDVTGMHVHHKNDDKFDNRIENLQILTPIEHAILHANDAERKELQRQVGSKVAKTLVEKGLHVFQNYEWDHSGENNGMHSSSPFWKDENKVNSYKEKQSTILKNRDGDNSAVSMQSKAVKSKMLNYAYQMIEAGYDISSFEKYYEARKSFAKLGVSKQDLKDKIKNNFGSYKKFYNSLELVNHVVLSVEPIGVRKVYDVQVECNSPEDRSIKDWHNFAIGGLDCEEGSVEGKVTFVHNTRRAAKMVVLDADHPEIVEFVNWKRKEEEKVAFLNEGAKKINDFMAHCESTLKDGTYTIAELKDIAADKGIPTAVVDRVYQCVANNIEIEFQHIDYDWQGEAYQTVSGQNSNNSVGITDDFMKRVEANQDWHLTARTDGSVMRTMKAADLWKDIAYNAWACADPGLHYQDTINEWHTCKADGKIRASNPCSEYLFLDNTACNLASINLLKFYDAKSGSFDYAGYEHIITLTTIALDISVSMGQYPSRQIAEGSMNYRTLGLGYANLGGLLMTAGIPYDSEVGREICGILTSMMCGRAYETSAKLAKQLGAFPRYEANKASMLYVLEKHGLENEKLLNHESGDYEPEFVLDGVKWLSNKEYWKNALDKAEKHGVRNAQVTVIAPTGTIGLVMDCDTTGIEPDFSLVKYKSLAGGGSVIIANTCIASALEALGFGNNEAGSIAASISEEIAKGNTDVRGMLAKILSPEQLKVFDCASEISPFGHVDMMAAAQPFISGAISKTINMPMDATVQDVQDVYKHAWDVGLKALAIYRDGSKFSQPLSKAKSTTDKAEVVDSTKVKSASENTRVQETTDAAPIRKRLPNNRNGKVQAVKINGHKVYITTGEYEDGSLGEIFINMRKEGTALGAMLNNFAVAVSIGLQYGVPLEEFVDAFTFTKSEPSGMVQGHDHIKSCTSIADLIMRHVAIYYQNRLDLSHTAKMEKIAQVEAEVEEAVAMHSVASLTSDAPKLNYESELCPCGDGYHMVRAGTCLTCTKCGETTGCS